ncbi:hypothetical protein GCM10009737_27860 [Nocardioides lentus]|uniref:DhaL domain-containing protein n=1 Tax=Nocardioides lentus TaxID=338077 RepID=A0ABN2PMK1_9ACTN
MQQLADGPDEADALVRFLDVAVAGLARAREEIDALNVYPVPDGDTGTNLYLTVSAARDAVGASETPAGSPADGRHADGAWAAMARGALLGARGNSGVILSQMLGAVAATTTAAPDDRPPAAVLADALDEATRASYEAVAAPVEGTILSVAAAASRAARQALEPITAGPPDPAADVRRVITAAAAAARAALQRTPEQLPVLAAAGVVDAGGRGLVVVLEAAERVLTGRRPVSQPEPLPHHRIPVPGRPRPTPAPDPRAPDAADPAVGPAVGPAAGPAAGPAGPAYEVVYLLRADDAAVAELRARLAGLGDSLVVVGGQGLWKVHVHVDDAGAAVEAALAAGTPEDIRITHLASQAPAA